LDNKNKNIYDFPTLNSNSYYNNNLNKKINYTKNGLNENNISYEKSRSISLTPNGFYRINNNDNYEYINIRTDSIENNSNDNSFKIDKKEEIIKTISQNNNNMTQSKFYKRLIPNANQNLNSNNFDYALNEFKNRNNKNRYNEKIENNRISHSFTNLSYNSLYKNNELNDFSNSYNISKNSHITNNTYNDLLYNNNYNIDNVNDLNYGNSINSNINKTINTFRTSNFLKRGNSYTNLHSLLNINNSKEIIRNDEGINLNEIIPNNYKYNNNNITQKPFSNIRNYRIISSPQNDFNNYMNSINMNQKRMGNQIENLCNTGLRRRMLNDSDLEDIFSYQREKNISRNNSHNIFRINMKKLCQNCQNMFNLNKFK
jgi:translation initiation factor IF-2